VPLLRSDTPGVANVLHFNNAGAALPPRPVLDAVTSHLAREAAIGGVEAAAEAADRIADVYDAISTALIGVGPRVTEHTITWIHNSPFPSYEDVRLKKEQRGRARMKMSSAAPSPRAGRDSSDRASAGRRRGH
jgi:hypothetical protein